MGDIAIFSFIKHYKTSKIASANIARFVSDEIRVPVIVDDKIAEKPLKLLIIVNGAYAFCNALEPLADAILAAKHVVWIQNDYTIIPPKVDGDAQSPFRKAFVTRYSRGQRVVFWSTCEDWAKLPGSTYVNWNSLTFNPDAVEAITKRRKTAGSDLFYYGSWRTNGNMGKEGYRTGKNGREKYFDRYFKSPWVETTISTPAKQFEEKYGGVLRYEPKIEGDLHVALSSHGMGLYIEDRMSHERFHSPANRFYEMLSAGLPMVFQPECGSMLRRAGYDPSPFIVNSKTDLQRAMEKREAWGRQQREAFVEKAMTERDNLGSTIKKLYKGAVK